MSPTAVNDGVRLDPSAATFSDDRLRVLEHAVQNISDALMITQAAPLEEPGPRIVFVNRAFETITGYPASEVIGRSPRFLKAPDIADDSCARIRDALRERKCVRETVLNCRKDGTLFWIEMQISPLLDERGVVTHFVSVERDVTERMRVQRLLEESQRRLAEAEAVAQLGSWEWDIARDVAHWSDQMYRICGMEPQSRTLTRAMFLQMVHPQDQNALNQLVDDLIATRETVETQFRLIRPDGVVRHVSTRGSVVCDERGMPVRMVGAMQDITDRIEAERVRVQAERLEAANKELEAFSYSVAHDLRAPVRRILGFLTVIGEPGNREELSSEVQHCLDAIKSSAQLMSQLINDMLALANVIRRPLKRENCDLAQVAKELLLGFASNEPDRDVECIIEPDLFVRADANLVRILMENLLSNAWKFTRRRDRPRIVVRREPPVDSVSVFCVEDNGVGFDPAYAHHLFRPFERLHPAGEFEGTGIGLTTVQRIVARHGGFVRGEGEPGRGAKFIFSLGA